MNPLQLRLAALRRRLRLQITWRGLCALTGLMLGGAVLVGAVDWLVDLPGLIRALALVGLLAAAGVVAYQVLILPLWMRLDDLSLALRIEDSFPDLNDALASTIQFLQQSDSDKDTQADSPGLRQAAIRRTLALTENCDFSKILDRRGLLWTTGAALVAVLAAGHFLFHHAQFSEIALVRLADPFGQHTWTRIVLDETPHRIAQGQPFVIRGQVRGVVPGAARVELEGVLRTEKVIPIKTDAKKPHTGSLIGPIDMTQQKGKFRFRVYANDATYPPLPGQWHEVEVLPPPKFALLDGDLSPRIELRYPAYTDLPSPELLTPGRRDIKGVAGTHVTYRAAFDRPLEEAWIEFRPENPNLRSAALLADLGVSQPLGAAAALVMSDAVWGRVYARFETKQIVHMAFIPWVSGKYVMHVRDEHGLIKDFESDLSVEEDPVPIVQLHKPATSLSVVPDAEIAIKALIADERFAIRSVYLEFRVKDAQDRWLADRPERLMIYDHAGLGNLLPRLMAGLASSPVSNLSQPLPDLRLRAKSLEIATKWALQNRFQEGQTVVLQLGADDFCNLFRDRLGGRSHEIELRIVGKAEIARILDEGLGKVQQELVRVQQMQDESLNLVKDIQQKQAKNAPTQKDLDQLIEAEQIQKQIQERLGNRPEEGLRDQLAKLQQTIKDNKLPPSETQDQIKTLANELDRLAQEDMQQIEPNLAEARREMAGAARPESKKKSPAKGAEPKPAPKDKGPLAKAEKLQEQAKKTLDELAKFLDPWAGMHQIKGETRTLLDKQRELKKDTEKLQQDAQAQARPDSDLQPEMDRKAEAQKDLADRAQKLLDMMAKAQAKRTQDGDLDSAAKLRKTENIGKDASLPQEMKNIAKEIKQNHPNSAIQKQQANIKNIEKMLTALEERKDNDLDRLQKKQKNAAEVKENLDKLAKDQDRLQKKAKDASKTENPEERAKELKKLAEEQNKLKEEAEKNARELARLQEERVSKALNRAAQEMAKAARQLEDGQDAEENQEDALDRLDEAQANLEEFEEELAREQLAKIADQIKGLKERQDAALTRSHELHKKLMARKKWTTGLLDTLGGDIHSQEGLAGETRSLKEKIKEAKVFEHVFEKAAKAMDEAGKAMEKRKEAGKERRFAELEKEEIADENVGAQTVERLQALASRRLQRLLDAIKNDPTDVAQNEEEKKEPGAGNGDQPKARAADGIPPVAQLKVLRAEQLEINERTKEFSKQNPDPKNLNEAQRRELENLEAEQASLHRLFEQMTAPAEKQGDMP